MGTTEPFFEADSPIVDAVLPSPNHGDRAGNRAADCIILHYTGMADGQSALDWLRNPKSQVSAHYFLWENGSIAQLVPEHRRAWHAGKSVWRGETDVNSASIGIEIVHPGHDLSVPGPLPPPGPAYPEAQIAALIRLLSDIVARRRLDAARILAHSDVAPGRKIDPGEGFPWEKLARAGLGLWPSAPIPRRAASYRPGDQGQKIARLQGDFARLGYGLEVTGLFDARTFDVVVAFQRHWRASKVDGIADGETRALLAALLENALTTPPYGARAAYSAATTKLAGS